MRKKKKTFRIKLTEPKSFFFFSLCIKTVSLTYEKGTKTKSSSDTFE